MSSRSAPTATTRAPYAGSPVASRRAWRLVPEPGDQDDQAGGEGTRGSLERSERGWRRTYRRYDQVASQEPTSAPRPRATTACRVTWAANGPTSCIRPGPTEPPASGPSADDEAGQDATGAAADGPLLPARWSGRGGARARGTPPPPAGRAGAAPPRRAGRRRRAARPAAGTSAPARARPRSGWRRSPSDGEARTQQVAAGEEHGVRQHDQGEPGVEAGLADVGVQLRHHVEGGAEVDGERDQERRRRHEQERGDDLEADRRGGPHGEGGTRSRWPPGRRRSRSTRRPRPRRAAGTTRPRGVPDSGRTSRRTARAARPAPRRRSRREEGRRRGHRPVADAVGDRVGVGPVAGDRVAHPVCDPPHRPGADHGDARAGSPRS